MQVRDGLLMVQQGVAVLGDGVLGLDFGQGNNS